MYSKDDFIYLKNENRYLCPAGQKLHHQGIANQHGYKGRKYRALKNVCNKCLKQNKCLRKGSSRRSLFITKEKPKRTHSLDMKEKMDIKKGRQIYSERMGIVEPVFANIRYNKNMNRFTLRAKEKVNIGLFPK